MKPAPINYYIDDEKILSNKIKAVVENSAELKNLKELNDGDIFLVLSSDKHDYYEWTQDLGWAKVSRECVKNKKWSFKSAVIKKKQEKNLKEIEEQRMKNNPLIGEPKKSIMGVGQGITICRPVAYQSQLPTNPKFGDAYFVTEQTCYYVWNGTKWLSTIHLEQLNGKFQEEKWSFKNAVTEIKTKLFVEEFLKWKKLNESNNI